MCVSMVRMLPSTRPSHVPLPVATNVRCSQLVWGRSVDELLEYLVMFLWSDLSCALLVPGWL